MNDLAQRRRLVSLLAGRCQGCDIIVADSLGAIPWAAWVAEAIGLPMAYVRHPKGYGRQRAIEGGDVTGKRVALLVTGADVPVLEGAMSIKIVEVGE